MDRSWLMQILFCLLFVALITLEATVSHSLTQNRFIDRSKYDSADDDSSSASLSLDNNSSFSLKRHFRLNRHHNRNQQQHHQHHQKQRLNSAKTFALNSQQQRPKRGGKKLIDVDRLAQSGHPVTLSPNDTLLLTSLANKQFCNRSPLDKRQAVVTGDGQCAGSFQNYMCAGLCVSVFVPEQRSDNSDPGGSSSSSMANTTRRDLVICLYCSPLFAVEPVSAHCRNGSAVVVPAKVVASCVCAAC